MEAGVEIAGKRQRVKEALQAMALTAEMEEVAQEVLEVMEADEAAVREMARLWETYWCDVVEQTTFEPGLAKLRVKSAVRERLASMGF